jgi:4-amino-4-deoxy-L-arabinose transferase-like glycosyltransferase
VRPAPEPYFRWALAAIMLATLFRLMWLAGNPIDLYPDEAQYWIWAQHPDWGYYSKPPMVAWMIWATTAAFGEAPLGVKAGALIAYVLTSLVVYALARRLYDARVAVWSAVAFVTLPAVSISSVIISTDVPLLLFWALASYGLVRAREPGGDRWWLVVGVAAGLGLLSKYAMGFWLGSAAAFLLVFPDERRHLRGFLWALLFAVAIYAPNFLWNWQHGFVSYLHTRDNANVHGFSLHPLEFAEFAGGQFLVFGPIFLATLLLIAGRWRQADRRTALLLMLAVPTLAVMLVVAMLSRAQPNWSAPAYVTSVVLVVGWLSEARREALVQWSVVLHVALATVALGIGPAAHKLGYTLPGRWDPLHRLHGWQIMGHALGEVRREQGMPPMLADEREFMAAMTYYMEPHPFDMRMWNPGGGVRNGFEMAQSLPDEAGGDYLWITQRTDREEVYRCFDKHDQVAHLVVPIGKGLTREAWVYALHGFKGYRPAG